MSDKKIDTRGQNCPQPFIEVRLALRNMAPGQVLEVRGDNQLSRREIPLQLVDGQEEVLEDREHPDGSWTLLIRKGNG